MPLATYANGGSREQHHRRIMPEVRSADLRAEHVARNHATTVNAIHVGAASKPTQRRARARRSASVLVEDGG